jgi:hypothetical protein
LLYSKHAARYEGVINGLRAKAVLDVYSDPNWSRADAGTHKRTNELVVSLIGLQREKSKPSTIEVIAGNNPSQKLEVKDQTAES